MLCAMNKFQYLYTPCICCMFSTTELIMQLCLCSCANVAVFASLPCMAPMSCLLLPAGGSLCWQLQLRNPPMPLSLRRYIRCVCRCRALARHRPMAAAPTHQLPPQLPSHPQHQRPHTHQPAATTSRALLLHLGDTHPSRLSRALIAASKAMLGTTAKAQTLMGSPLATVAMLHSSLAAHMLHQQQALVLMPDRLVTPPVVTAVRQGMRHKQHQQLQQGMARLALPTQGTGHLRLAMAQAVQLRPGMGPPILLRQGMGQAGLPRQGTAQQELPQPGMGQLQQLQQPMALQQLPKQDMGQLLLPRQGMLHKLPRQAELAHTQVAPLHLAGTTQAILVRQQQRLLLQVAMHPKAATLKLAQAITVAAATVSQVSSLRLEDTVSSHMHRPSLLRLHQSLHMVLASRAVGMARPAEEQLMAHLHSRYCTLVLLC